MLSMSRHLLVFTPHLLPRQFVLLGFFSRKISHEAINTIEDEEDIRAQLLYSNAMYAYAELPLSVMQLQEMPQNLVSQEGKRPSTHNDQLAS